MEKQWEERTKKETQTGANGSPRGVDDRHTGDLRIILCDLLHPSLLRASDPVFVLFKFRLVFLLTV